jgi:hypothetical protein
MKRPPLGRETRYLFRVDGDHFDVESQPCVPTGSSGTFFLPRLKTTGRLGVDLFDRQSDARRKATANAQAGVS